MAALNLRTLIDTALDAEHRAFQETGNLMLKWIVFVPSPVPLIIFPSGEVSEKTLPHLLEKVSRHCARLGALAVLHVTPMADEDGSIRIVQALAEMRFGFKGFEWRVAADGTWTPEALWYDLDENEQARVPRLLPYGTSI